MFSYLLSKIVSPKLETTDYLPAFLEPYVILFGSRRWNVHTKKSDVDVLVETGNYPLVKALLTENGIPYKPSYRGHYDRIEYGLVFTLNNLTYELSSTNTRDYQTYSTVCQIFDTFALESTMFKNKPYRVELFHQLVHVIDYKQQENTDKHLLKHIKTHYPEVLI